MDERVNLREEEIPLLKRVGTRAGRSLKERNLRREQMRGFLSKETEKKHVQVYPNIF